MLFELLSKIPVNLIFQNRTIQSFILFVIFYAIIFTLLGYVFKSCEKHLAISGFAKHLERKITREKISRKKTLFEIFTKRFGKKIPTQYVEFYKYLALEKRGEKKTALALILMITVTFMAALAMGLREATLCFATFVIIYIIAFAILYRMHQNSISREIPLLLGSMSNALKAGYSFLQSLQILAKELPMPLAFYIRIARDRILLGQNTEKALTRVRDMLQNNDMNFVIDSTVIQLKSGGNICKFYEKLSANIQEKTKLEKDLKTAVSQGKLSGIIIAALWPISLALFYLLSPNYVNVLFQTRVGNLLIFISLLLEIVGFFLIHKITKLPL